jgi:glycosyltransferase involved in cell wall biosynthesis
MNAPTAALARPVARDAPHEQRLSIVVPLYNEQENVRPLIEAVHAAMAASPWPWELILVDDGSSDGTLGVLELERAARGDHVRVIAFRRNFGQTAAMQAGIEAARGDLIATLDGDLQNDPDDIVRLAQHLLGGEFDVVAGWRKQRQDTFLSRRLPSLLANRLIGRMTGVHLHDYGCTLKLYKAEFLKPLRLYGEMHRFIPAWLATVTSPGRMAEEAVLHHPRVAGTSKVGPGRSARAWPRCR